MNFCVIFLKIGKIKNKKSTRACKLMSTTVHTLVRVQSRSDLVQLHISLVVLGVNTQSPLSLATYVTLLKMQYLPVRGSRSSAQLNPGGVLSLAAWCASAWLSRGGC